MRLNPFAFPSDTTFRFLLLIAAIVGVSLLAFDWLYGQFADLRAEAAALIACSAGLPTDPTQVATDAQLVAFRSCLAAVNGTRLDAVLLGMVALVIGGGVAYGIAVARLRRRYRVLDRADAPELVAQIDALAGEMGVTPAPGLRWQPLDRRALGLAFGRPGHRELALTGGLVPLTVRDPAAFRAIVLHELAHLRNRDVDLSYYAIGIFRAVLVLAILPFALALLRTLLSDPGTVFSFVWRFTVLLPLVYVIRSGILRAREHDADLRASTLEPEIRRVLASARDHTPSKLRRLIAWHPSAARRVAVIDDPSPLLHLGVLDAFGVGIVGSLAYEEVATLVGYFGFESFTTRALSGLAFGPLVGIIVALGVWRQTFAFLATGRGPVRVAWLGLALAAGLFVGQRLSLLTAISDDSVILRPDPAPFYVWLAVLVTVGALLFGAWLVAASRMWLPVATRLRSPTRASMPVALGAAVLVTIAIAVFEIVVASRQAVEAVVTTPSDILAAIRVVVPDVGPEALFRLVLSPEVQLIIQQPLVVAFFVILVPGALGGRPLLREGPVEPEGLLGGAGRRRGAAAHRQAGAPRPVGRCLGSRRRARHRDRDGPPLRRPPRHVRRADPRDARVPVRARVLADLRDARRPGRGRRGGGCARPSIRDAPRRAGRAGRGPGRDRRGRHRGLDVRLRAGVRRHRRPLVWCPGRGRLPQPVRGRVPDDRHRGRGPRGGHRRGDPLVRGHAARAGPAAPTGDPHATPTAAD